MKLVWSKLKEKTFTIEFTRCFVRLLAASHQFPREFVLDAQCIVAIREFCIDSLEQVYVNGSPLNVRNSLDCCTLVRSLQCFLKYSLFVYRHFMCLLFKKA